MAKRRIILGLIVAALAIAGSLMTAGDAQAAGRGQPSDWQRFYSYPYVYYPQNFQRLPESYDHLYYRYPVQKQIPVYNSRAGTTSTPANAPTTAATTSSSTSFERREQLRSTQQPPGCSVHPGGFRCALLLPTLQTHSQNQHEQQHDPSHDFRANAGPSLVAASL